MADFFDNFTVGTGTLSGRTTTSGGTWILDQPTAWEGQTPSAPLTDLTLAAEGMQQTSAGWQARGYVGLKPSQQPTGFPYAAELKFIAFNRNIDWSFWTRFAITTLEGVGANSWMGARVLIRVNYDSAYPTELPDVPIELGGAASDGNFYWAEGGTVYPDTGPTSSFMGVEHAVRIVFYSDRMEAYYDGILIGTLDDFNAKTRYQSLTGNSKNIRCEIGDWGNYHTDPHGLQYTSFRIYNPNADWLKAEFNGPNTLNLSTYVPEVNTLVIPPWPAEGRGNEGISVPLSSYLLTGTGQVYINPAYDQNIQTDIMSLAPGSPPPSNDYYHEVEINLPSVASLGDSYNHLLYVGIASRVIPSSYNPPYSANALNMMVDFDVFNGGWRFYAEMWDYLYLGESIDYDDWWDFPEFVLGANAQTVKLRVQVKGRMWNFWVNGVQQASHGVKDFYWTGASSLDSGTCKMSINMENYGSGPVGVGPPGIRIEAYRAGGILLFTPPPPGAFWTEYQACAEVLP